MSDPYVKILKLEMENADLRASLEQVVNAAFPVVVQQAGAVLALGLLHELADDKEKARINGAWNTGLSVARKHLRMKGSK